MSKIYTTKKYLTTNRLMAYLEQYDYVSEGDMVLEIGNGAGVFQFLASKIAKCYTIDSDSTTNPDYVVDITDKTEMDKLKNNYDKIFCCQVLEHLPFDQAVQSLDNILKLNAKQVCISVLNNENFLSLILKIPFINIKKIFTIPFSGKKIIKTNQTEHYWEIYSKNKKEIVDIFKDIAKQNDYKLVRNYRLFNRPCQHFFIFDKK